MKFYVIYMNIRDLEYFNSVCKTKNFTKAAKELFVSQPAITNSINRLELELKSKLIERNPFNKEIMLTEAGEIVKKHSKNIFNEIDEMNLEISKIKDKKIKFGIPPMIGAYFFPLFIGELMKKNLEEDIEFVEVGSLKMNEFIKEGKVDIAIIGSLDKINNENVESTLLKIDKFKVCVGKKHRLARKKKLTLKDIENEIFIVLGSSYIHGEVIKSLIESSKINPKKIFNSDEIQTTKSLIASDVGIGIMINMAVQHMPGIKVIDLEEDMPFYISIVVKKNHYITTKEKEIIDTIIINNKNS
ncbi:MAG: LysR family transcriptional regulator [Sarcina sp.]